MKLSLDLSKRYTYADYLTWMDDVRRELVDGFIKVMASARPPHQDISGNLYTSLRGIIRRGGGHCAVYEDIDVCFTEDGSRDASKVTNVLSPDVCVVCDISKIDDESGCWGAPDLVVEIQSPTTGSYDRTVKYGIYERYGVREYWVVYPLDRRIEVFTLGVDGRYGSGVVYEKGRIPVGIFGGKGIVISRIFKRQLWN
jgi:Uma2 family endonuclease